MAHDTVAMSPLTGKPAKPSGLHMLVIGAGLPRTGTASCWVALQKLLGAPCYHMAEVMRHQDKHIRAWARQQLGEPLNPEVIQILEPYSACTDVPTMLYWKQLLALNPDAKVLLTVRGNFDAWYESVTNTVYQMHLLGNKMPWYAAFFNPAAKIKPVVGKNFFGPKGLFQGRFEDKDFANKVYEDYIEDVKRSVPKDQLLVFNVKEGWEPLCKFLNVPVPTEPFPQVNEREFFRTELLAHQQKLLWWLKYGIPLMLGGAATSAVILGMQLSKRRS